MAKFRNFDKKKLEGIMEKHKLPFHSISAKTGDNIESLFFSVVDMINENQLKRQKQVMNVDEDGAKTDKPLRGNETDRNVSK